MKKTKIMLIFLTTIIIISISNFAIAAPAPGDIKIENNNIQGTEDLKLFGEKVFDIIQIVGIVSSVIILAIVGIKTITGSTQDKAVYVKAAMPYLIGAIILFAAPKIAQITYDISQEITKPVTKPVAPPTMLDDTI